MFSLFSLSSLPMLSLLRSRPAPAQRRAAFTAALTVATLLAGSAAHAQITRVITNAATVPGEAGTLRFSDFSRVSLNNSGQVTFYAAYNSSQSLQGWFATGVSAGGTASTLLKVGTTDPAHSGNSFYDLSGSSSLSLDNNGRTVFSARSRPPGFAGTAGVLYSTSISGAPITLVQDTGTAAPNGLGSFNALIVPQGTDDGGVAFIGSAQGAGSSTSTFRRTSAGGVIQASSENNGALRAFATDRTTGAIAVANQSGITSSGAAAPTALSSLPFIARISLTAPGTGGGTYVGFNGGIGNNGTGDVSFVATTRLSGNDKDGLFRYNASDGSTSLLAQVGQQIPGMSAGIIFKTMDTPGLSREGTTFFQAQAGTLFGSGTSGLYGAAANGDLTKFVAVGDALFGSTLQSFFWSGQAGVNDQGQAAFGYVLDNGERGIALTPARTVSAAAPDAPSGVLALLGLVPLGAGIVRRRIKGKCAG